MVGEIEARAGRGRVMRSTYVIVSFVGTLLLRLPPALFFVQSTITYLYD